jgi:hypothetical protein
MFQASAPTFLTTRLIIISQLKALRPAATKTRIPFDPSRDKQGYAALCAIYAAAFDPPKACDRSTDGDP